MFNLGVFISAISMVINVISKRDSGCVCDMQQKADSGIKN